MSSCNEFLRSTSLISPCSGNGQCSNSTCTCFDSYTGSGDYMNSATHDCQINIDLVRFLWVISMCVYFTCSCWSLRILYSVWLRDKHRDRITSTSKTSSNANWFLKSMVSKDVNKTILLSIIYLLFKTSECVLRTLPILSTTSETYAHTGDNNFILTIHVISGVLYWTAMPYFFLNNFFKVCIGNTTCMVNLDLQQTKEKLKRMMFLLSLSAVFSCLAYSCVAAGGLYFHEGDDVDMMTTLSIVFYSCMFIATTIVVKCVSLPLTHHFIRILQTVSSVSVSPKERNLILWVTLYRKTLTFSSSLYAFICLSYVFVPILWNLQSYQIAIAWVWEVPVIGMGLVLIRPKAGGGARKDFSVNGSRVSSRISTKRASATVQEDGVREKEKEKEEVKSKEKWQNEEDYISHATPVSSATRTESTSSSTRSKASASSSKSSSFDTHPHSRSGSGSGSGNYHPSTPHFLRAHSRSNSGSGSMNYHSAASSASSFKDYMKNSFDSSSLLNVGSGSFTSNGNGRGIGSVDGNGNPNDNVNKMSNILSKQLSKIGDRNRTGTVMENERDYTGTSANSSSGQHMESIGEKSEKNKTDEIRL